MPQVYLRDLKSELHHDYIRQWKKDSNPYNDFSKKAKAKRLLEAYKNGEDIAIGEYWKSGKEHLVDL